MKIKKKEIVKLWMNSSFNQLWLGQTVSVLGSQISFIAIPLIAVILLDADSFQMGILTATITAPFLLIGLFAGVWVDRVKRVPILLYSNLLGAVILLLIPLLNSLNILNIWLLYLIAFLSASCSMMFQFAYTSVLPSIVSKEALTEGNSKLEATRATTQFIGPSIAGVLIQTFTAPVAILINAATELFSLVFLKRIKINEATPEKSANNVLQQIVSGFSILFKSNFLRTISLTTAVLNFARSAIDAVYILFIVSTLSVDAALIGIIYGVGSVGSIIGAMLANKLVKKIGIGATIILAAISIGIGFIVIAVIAGPLYIVIPLLLVSRTLTSMGNTLFFITQVSVRQALVPNEVMGRVNATQVFISRGAVPIGALLGGILGTWFGLRIAILLAGCFSLIAVFMLWMSPIRSIQQTENLEIQQ